MNGYQDLPMGHKRYLVAQILANQQLTEALASKTGVSYEDLVRAIGLFSLGETITMGDRAIEKIIETFNRDAQSYEHANLG